ncbi:hypothetical protein [Antarctobacter sp.]|uniref:hypothetical protein n=1 Tax=Antarctobacter sp. TaxID=1872577 RepID=UPI003A915615
MKIPAKEGPEVIHGLLKRRSLSPLDYEIHRESSSPDPRLRRQARKVLCHLGLPDWRGATWRWRVLTAQPPWPVAQAVTST